MVKIVNPSSNFPQSGLKVALVHDFLRSYGGAERVLHALHLLFPQAPIYTAIAEPRLIQSYFPDAKIYTSYLQRSLAKYSALSLLIAMPKAIESFDFNEYNLVISSSGAFAHGIITGPQTLHLSYCHSPMRYVWDWHLEYLSEKGILSGLKLGLAESFLSPIRVWDKVAASRVDAWIANSQTVAKRIEHFYRLPSQVIYPPVDWRYFDYQKLEAANQQTEEVWAAEYAITVSRLTPNKRIDLLIRACAKAKLPLMIVGNGAAKAELEKLAHSLKARIHFTGEVEEAKKRQLLGRAACFIFAAEDDFGIAPVEALSMGIPVLAYAKGGATETVIEKQNGFFFNEPTVEALSEAIERWRENSTSFSKAKIRSSVEKFSSTHFHQAMLDFIQEQVSTK
jgi:glycosyltransferase involved in cell wall biosynthesis